MFKSYKPTWQLQSIFCLTPEMLKEHHIHVILTDLDNTLVPWDKKEATPSLLKWIRMMEDSGIKIIIVSNNKESRVKEVAHSLGVEYISRANKPLPFGLKRALKQKHLAKENVVMVGDQLMTDINASYYAHIKSILVRPLKETDAWNTSINRVIERQVKRWMSKEIKWQWEEKL